MDLESGKESISYWKTITDQGAVTQQIVHWNYEGSGTEHDPYVVEWITDDPRNPTLWTTARKWLQVMAVSNSIFIVTFCASAFAGGNIPSFVHNFKERKLSYAGIPQLVLEFGASEEVVLLGLSLYVLGFAVGPLLWGPLSELYGRQVVFLGSFIGFTIFNAATAASLNIWTIIILRFIAATFGSSPLSNAGGVIADLFPAEKRGLPLSVFSAAPFVGPVLGPVIGGFLGMNQGWRWISGLMAIWSGATLVFVILTVPETYHPVLLKRRAETLGKLNQGVYKSRAEIVSTKVSLGQALSTALKRPWILLFHEPIVLFLSLYHALVYGILYMLFDAYPIVYGQYRGWNQGLSGLPFIAVAIGILAAILYVVLYDNKQYQEKSKESGNGYVSPEARLPMCIVGAIALPIGLFWFAWTNSPSSPWLASVAAGVPFGFGMVLIFMAITNYLVDSYTIFAASVLAGNGIIRSTFGAAFPLFTTQVCYTLLIMMRSLISH